MTLSGLIESAALPCAALIATTLALSSPAAAENSGVFNAGMLELTKADLVWDTQIKPGLDGLRRGERCVAQCAWDVESGVKTINAQVARIKCTPKDGELPGAAQRHFTLKGNPYWQQTDISFTPACSATGTVILGMKILIKANIH
jgi:hypothetical protein